LHLQLQHAAYRACQEVLCWRRARLQPWLHSCDSRGRTRPSRTMRIQDGSRPQRDVAAPAGHLVGWAQRCSARRLAPSVSKHITGHRAGRARRRTWLPCTRPLSRSTTRMRVVTNRHTRLRYSSMRCADGVSFVTSTGTPSSSSGPASPPAAAAAASGASPCARSCSGAPAAAGCAGPGGSPWACRGGGFGSGAVGPGPAAGPGSGGSPCACSSGGPATSAGVSPCACSSGGSCSPAAWSLLSSASASAAAPLSVLAGAQLRRTQHASVWRTKLVGCQVVAD